MKKSERLREIARIIEAVEQRCQAFDGPVVETLKEMDKAELIQIYNLAKGFPEDKIFCKHCNSWIKKRG